MAAGSTVLEPPGDGDLRSYATFELAVLHHAITLADAKASFILAIALGAFAAELPGIVHAQLSPGAGLHAGLVLASGLLLVCTLAASYLTVYPRIWRSAEDRATLWSAAIFRQPPAAFEAACREGLGGERITSGQLLHLYTLSGILRLKYRYLAAAFVLAPLAFVTSVGAQLLG